MARLYRASPQHIVERQICLAGREVIMGDIDARGSLITQLGPGSVKRRAVTSTGSSDRRATSSEATPCYWRRCSSLKSPCQ
jgi:hypothetical protein